MMKRSKKGLVHIYTGGGKGKTTAAFGLGMRAVGNGLKVHCFQFLKGKDPMYGEVKAAQKFGARFRITRFDQTHPYFLPPTKRKEAGEELKRSIRISLETVKTVIIKGSYDLIILDELIIALRDGFVDLKSVLDLIDSKPKKTELVLTGRAAPKALIRKADYVTEMRNLKHPYKKGIKARQGVEF